MGLLEIIFKPGILLLIFFLSISAISEAQETTLDNYTGDWGDDVTWVSGTSPGYSLTDDVVV